MERLHVTQVKVRWYVERGLAQATPVAKTPAPLGRAGDGESMFERGRRTKAETLPRYRRRPGCDYPFA